MKAFAVSVVALSAFALVGIANAEPVKLGKEQMASITAGAITTTTTQLNGGGNTPKGTANGVPIVSVSTNPAGSAPPGQNK